jgi:flagellar basal body rod protein FlgB
MKLLKNGLYVLGICLLAITTSCENDDDISSIIGGLDFVVATLNADGTEVGVVASTVPGDNRILYTVEFGDPNGIDIEDGNGNSSDVIQTTSGPMVKYKYPEETATYTITVTASLPGRDDVSITKDHTVIFAVEPPPGGDDPLVGSWRLAPEAGAFGVGPGLNDVSWFSSSSDDVTTRACLFDDEYVFNADGTFQNVLGSETWLETWQGVAAEECGAPVFPHDGTATATYMYNPSGSVTLDGTGAFLGLAKVINGAELASPGDAPSSITYIAEVSADGNTLDLDIEIAGGGFWSFKLVKDAPPEPSALDGAWKFAPESGAFGVGPALGDVSWFSSSADDVTTRDCLFDDTYVFNADGTFENVLGSETWLETWQGVATEACGTPVFPHDGSASATYDYDATAGTITINGTGAFLGLAKVFNLGELTNPADAPSSITYLADLSADGNTLDLDIEIAGGGYWSFKLVKDVVPTGIQGTWRMAPESGAFGVGPAMGDVSWFSSTADDVTTRDCFFDDEYVFNADGSFQNVLGSETWLEGWQGVATEGCGAPVFPHDGTASATYDYDEGAGTITIDGAGAFLGLAKVFNLGELTNPADAPSSITYIAELSADGNTLDLDIEIAGGGYWSFKLARQ